MIEQCEINYCSATVIFCDHDSDRDQNWTMDRHVPIHRKRKNLM
jgi:hypothetical protein